MREQFIPDLKKIEQREDWQKEVISRQNHLYLRAKLTTGTQKQRKQSNQAN